MASLQSGDLLVSFSGESHSPIQDLYAISPQGQVQSNVLGSTFNELRGIAFGGGSPDWTLYVVQAHKTDSKVWVFDSDLSLSTEITPNASAGLWHPYEVVVGSDEVLVSNQDSNTVLAFDVPIPCARIAARPIASYLADNPSWSTQFPGTVVASHAPQTNQGVTPDKVPKGDGGLDFNSAEKHSVRGIVLAGGILYVADEPGDRIAMYRQDDGTFLGELTSSKDHSLQSPVGCAFNSVDGCLYFGSTGNRRIFRYDPSSGTDELSVFLHDEDKLDKVSGIAFSSAGDLFTASRSTCLVYTAAYSSTTLRPLVSLPFADSPECLAVVP